jgi:hypothetical protein
MRYLLFDWGFTDEDTIDHEKLTDQEFEELAKGTNGFIFENSEDFQRAFEEQQLSTGVHQLRIIDDITPELKHINELILDNEIGAWESDLSNTRAAIILEDFQELNSEDITDGGDGILKYNGWALRLLNLTTKTK